MTDFSSMVARLEAFIGRQDPGRNSPGISAFSQLPVGFSYETYLFTLSWQDDSGPCQEDMVMRMEPEFGLIPPYDVRPQYELLSRLHGSTIPVPEVFWLEASGDVLGRPFFIMGRIPGETMFAYAQKHPESLPDLRRQLVEVIIDLHQLDWRALGLGILGVPENLHDNIENEIDRWKRELDKSMLFPYPFLDEIHRYLRNNIPDAQDIAFCHCDIQPANILVENGRISGVLDWELATLGDPLADLGWSCATIEKFFGSEWNENDYIRQYYQQRTGRRINDDHLNFWKILSFYKGITMVFTGLRAGLELPQPKANLLGLYPTNMATFPDAAARLMGF